MLEKPLACAVPIFHNSVTDTAKLIHDEGTDHPFILHMKSQVRWSDTCHGCPANRSQPGHRVYTGCLDADRGVLGTLRRTQYIGPDARPFILSILGGQESTENEFSSMASRLQKAHKCQLRYQHLTPHGQGRTVKPQLLTILSIQRLHQEAS